MPASTPTDRSKRPLPDHYRVLVIPPTATQEEIKDAYLKRIRAFHPDVSRRQDESDLDYQKRTSRAAKINVAYRVLRDPATRAAYDLDLLRARERAEYEAAARDTAARETATREAAGRDVATGGTADQGASGGSTTQGGGPGRSSAPGPSTRDPRARETPAPRTAIPDASAYFTVEDLVGFLFLVPLGQWVLVGLASVVGVALSLLVLDLPLLAALTPGWIFLFAQPVILLGYRFVGYMDWSPTRQVSVRRTPLGMLVCLPFVVMKGLLTIGRRFLARSAASSSSPSSV